MRYNVGYKVKLKSESSVFNKIISLLKYCFLFLFAAIFVCSCAKVKFYEDAALKTETGLRFYSAKPYLLVARTGAKDKPVEVSIIHLPDLKNPQYAYYRAGMGSNKINMALTNSILTSYGLETDAKISETITALGSLTTATGGIIKAIAEAEKIREEAKKVREEASPEEIRRAAEIVKLIAGDLQEAAKTMGDRLDKIAKKEISSIVTELYGIAAALEAPTASAKLSETVDRLKKATDKKRWDKLKHTAAQNDPIDFNARMEKDKKLLKEALELLEPSPPPTEKTTFELYEIRQEQGATTLIHIPLQ